MAEEASSGERPLDPEQPRGSREAGKGRVALDDSKRSGGSTVSGPTAPIFCGHVNQDLRWVVDLQAHGFRPDFS